MLPSNYNPTKPEEFIGPARAVAVYLQTLTATVLPTREPFRNILSGPPGVGKSKLASCLVGLCGGGKWNLTKLNGTQAKLEEVEAVAGQFHLTDLFGGYRVLWVEEIDKMPAVARSRMLTLCDDMPRQWALVGTTNLTPAQMQELHPPTKRRYTFLEVGAPSCDELFAFLRKNWPEVPEAFARQIAVMSCGCVGDALQEADAHYVMGLAQAKAA